MRVFVACVVLAVVVCARPQNKYTTKYDNIDLDEIIKNDRLMKNYVNCLLDKGNCSPDGAELKKVLPDALKSECSKCSEKQREGSKKIINHLIDNKPECGGSIRDAGGSFGRQEAAKEEEYFYRQQREQLHKLKDDWVLCSEQRSRLSGSCRKRLSRVVASS